jgi:hypothetical protein
MMNLRFALQPADLYAEMSVDLWNSRPRVAPADQLRYLADECDALNVHACDVYGDFDATPEKSYLRRFEHEVAGTFGKEDVSSAVQTTESASD